MKRKRSGLSAVTNSTSAFRIAYILDLFLCSIGYINIWAEYGKVIFFLWGLSLFTNRYLLENNIKKVNYSGWLILFILSNIITVIIRGYDEGIWESLLMALNMPIIFFMFYGLHSEVSSHSGARKVFKELYVLCNILMWLTIVINIFSIVSLYAVGKSVTYSYGYLVIYENRFTGIYYNPNLMAFQSFCSMVCCHILTKKDFVYSVTGKYIGKLKYAVILISAALNLAMILLSDSNATALIIICYILMTICYKFFAGRKLNFKLILRRCAALAVLLAVVTAGVFVFRSAFQTGTTLTMPTQEKEEENTNVFEDEEDELNKITFEHENTNLDSGRITLFFQGVNVIKHHPFFGVGKGDITKYGNRYNNNKMKYSDFHNGYLTIIVCSGFVGFALFAAFAGCLCKRMTALIFTLPMIKNDIFPCLFAFIFAYCVYALFEKTLVYEVSFMVTFFWLILGYATACMSRYEQTDKTTVFVSFEKSTPKEKLNKLIHRHTNDMEENTNTDTQSEKGVNDDEEKPSA